jgi:hypothetical protein
MSTFKPYTYFQCPCTDTSAPLHSSHTPPESPTVQEEERIFDPRAPRANYSLYPLEHLLYCEDCHQIRCSRCVLDEIVTWYCPNCLFEVPSSTVKSEGNRYTSTSPLSFLACNSVLYKQKTARLHFSNLIDAPDPASNVQYAYPLLLSVLSNPPIPLPLQQDQRPTSFTVHTACGALAKLAYSSINRTRSFRS